MEDHQHSTHQALRRQRRDLRSTRALKASFIDDIRQARKDLLAPLQHPPPTTRALHHTQPRKLRLTIKKRQHNPQPATHTLTPRQTIKPNNRQLTGDPPDSVPADLKQTILAITEQVIERPARHPRTSSDTRNSHTRPPQLLHRRHSPTKQPRTLHPSDLHPTITNPKLKRRHAPNTTPTTPTRTPTHNRRHQHSPPVNRERRATKAGSDPRVAHPGEHFRKRGEQPARRGVLLERERERER